MIDLHTHVLPGIDDGPDDRAGALALAAAARAAGTTVLVATPHITWDLPANDAARVAAGVAELAQAGPAVELRTGGEIALPKAAELPEDELLGLRLGGGEWLLCESPLSADAAGFDAVVLDLQARGHRVVLAHPERAPLIQRDPGTLRRLVEAGALSQVTAGSLTGQFGRTVQAFTHDLFREGLVHVVASDAHDAVRRPPGLLDALLAADRADLPGLAGQVEWLTADVPRAVLDGGPVPARPVPPPGPRRSRAARWLRRRG